jgi:hypothetical protein
MCGFSLGKKCGRGKTRLFLFYRLHLCADLLAFFKCRNQVAGSVDIRERMLVAGEGF